MTPLNKGKRRLKVVGVGDSRAKGGSTLDPFPLSVQRLKRSAIRVFRGGCG